MKIDGPALCGSKSISCHDILSIYPNVFLSYDPNLAGIEPVACGSIHIPNPVEPGGGGAGSVRAE